MATTSPTSESPSEQVLINSHQSKVLKSAILSRLLLLILILLWRTLLTPYDTSAPLNPSCLDQPSPSPPPPPPLLPALGSAIENGIVWDSVYFVRIAKCGYEYEQSYAFLPLLPVCIFILSRTGLILYYKCEELGLFLLSFFLVLDFFSITLQFLRRWFH